MNGLKLVLYGHLLCYLSAIDSRTLAASLDVDSNGHHVRHSDRKISETDRQLIQDAFHSLKPSVMMIPVDLQETVDKNLDPREQDLNTQELLKTLGSFRRRYMSIDQPRDSISNPNGTVEYKFKKRKMVPKDQEMPLELQALMQKTITLSSDGPELQVKFNRETRRKLQKFLWAYSYCPVRYKWKKLSQRFWPRWIKVGECDSQRSCSIPAGMTCQPSKMMDLDLLRFFCPFTSSESRTCRWITIKYPILKECECGCTTYSEYKT